MQCSVADISMSRAEVQKPNDASPIPLETKNSFTRFCANGCLIQFNLLDKPVKVEIRSNIVSIPQLKRGVQQRIADENSDLEKQANFVMLHLRDGGGAFTKNTGSNVREWDILHL